MPANSLNRPLFAAIAVASAIYPQIVYETGLSRRSPKGRRRIGNLRGHHPAAGSVLIMARRSSYGKHLREGNEKDGKIVYDASVRRKGTKKIYRTFSRLTDARNWVTDTESDIRNGRAVVQPQTESTRHTLSDAIERYLLDELPKKPRCFKDQPDILDGSESKRVIGFLRMLTRPC